LEKDVRTITTSLDQAVGYFKTFSNNANASLGSDCGNLANALSVNKTNVESLRSFMSITSGTISNRELIAVHSTTDLQVVKTHVDNMISGLKRAKTHAQSLTSHAMGFRKDVIEFKSTTLRVIQKEVTDASNDASDIRREASNDFNRTTTQMVHLQQQVSVAESKVEQKQDEIQAAEKSLNKFEAEIQNLQSQISRVEASQMQAKDKRAMGIVCKLDKAQIIADILQGAAIGGSLLVLSGIGAHVGLAILGGLAAGATGTGVAM
jgi:chromosome segregation ATPase